MPSLDSSSAFLDIFVMSIALLQNDQIPSHFNSPMAVVHDGKSGLNLRTGWIGGWWMVDWWTGGLVDDSLRVNPTQVHP
jgi:hypothetical protein